MRKKLQFWWVTAVAGWILGPGVFAASQAAAAPAARYIFRGGPIYTAEPESPTAEAVAVGPRGDILYVGAAGGVEAYRNDKTRVIDLKGQALFPGFVDANARLLSYGQSRTELDLSGVRGYEELVRRVAQAVKKTPLPNSWVIGRGWNENEWTVHDPIRLVNLQDVSGSHPVVLFHAVDDAAIANTVVMTTAQVLDDPPDPPGGRFLRTRGGLPTGVLLDAALDFVKPIVPGLGPDERLALYRAAAESCAVHGITQVHEMDLSSEGRQALETLARSKEGLPIRIYGVLAGDESGLLDRLAKERRRKDGGSLFKIGGIGLKVDGGLDTRGAALSEPYRDEPDYSGHFVTPPESLALTVGRIVDLGYQPVLRATGDAAVSLALDALQGVFGDSTGRKPGSRPPRIESVAVVVPGDIERMKGLGVVASMQPGRVSADYSWIEDRLGLDRKVRVHAWKSLEDAGVPLILSTGAPAGPLDPVQVFYAAVTRQNAAGRPATGWVPEERLTREQALQGLTRAAAAAISEEREGGTIAVGKRADLTVLSKDIMTVPEREILSARATLTVVGGRIVHERMSNP